MRAANKDEGEHIWHDVCETFNEERVTDGGGDHVVLRTVCSIAQRRMDQEEVTPVDMEILPREHLMGKKHGTGDDKLYPKVRQEVQILFRPGKSETTFREWLLGVKP